MVHDDLVTVIINCHNGEKYIRETIESVLNQTYDEFELLLVDNCSTDNTRDIFSSYNDKRLIYFKTSNKVSLGSARNIGLELSNGKYINFIDSDDIWESNKLEFQLHMIKGKNYSATYTQSINMYEDGRRILSSKRRSDEIISLEKISKYYDICLSSLMINFTNNKIKNYKFNENLEALEDADYVLKLLSESPMIYINKPLTIYRIHSENISNTRQDLFYKDIKLMKEEYKREGKYFLLQNCDYFYDIQLYITSLNLWKNNNPFKSQSKLIQIKRKSFKHFILMIIVLIPFKLLFPIFKKIGLSIK